MDLGVDPTELSTDQLLNELAHLYSTRYQTLRHGSDDALSAHTRRSTELEAEYLHRHPHREVDPGRTREGARERDTGDT